MNALLPGMSFDQHQRYAPVVRLLPSLAGPRPLVLDVGGHPGLLAGLADCRLVVADRVASGPRSVLADGERLPFPPETFDVVVSCDALEHVDPASRRSFVAELLRVSRRWVVLAAPFEHPDVAAAEIVLHEMVRGFQGAPYPFLAEHLEKGLPRLCEVEGWIESYGATVATLPNGYLPRWLAMMAVSFFLESHPRYAALRPIVAGTYARAFERHDAREPAYRHVILADKEEEDPGHLLDPLGSDPAGAPAFEPGYVLAFLGELRRQADVALPNDADLLLRQVGHLSDRLTERERALQAAELSRRELDAAYRALEAETQQAQGALGAAEAFVRNVERMLTAEQEAHARARADRLAVLAEHGRLEEYPRRLEARAGEDEARFVRAVSESSAREAARAEAAGLYVRVLAESESAQRERDVARAAGAAASMRAEELARELALAGDRVEALGAHAESLAGIVERLSRRPLDRLWRRIRGG